MTREFTVLKIVEKAIEFKTSEAHDPKKFYQDRKGLYVGYGFSERIVEKAEPVQSGTEYKVSSLELVKNAPDEKIEADLGEGHLFEDSAVCALIAEMISKQPTGEEGALLTNGDFNLFYTASCVVGVYWGGGGWSVRDWGRGVSAWNAGFRVFSPQLTLDL